MKITKYLSLPMLLAVLVAFSCSKKDNKIISPIIGADSINVLLIIADDLGKDAIKGFTEGSIKPNTPNIDAIRNNGLLFSNFWVNPTCTPTRGAIITGKYGYRTGVKGVGDVLSPSEVTLQKYISNTANNKYASAVVGKWHLSGNNAAANPETFGIDYYVGLIRGSVDDYYRWQMTEDGVSSLQTTYATELFTTLASNWISKQSKPWFMWLAYNAPHTPFHVPPSNMHRQGNLPPYVEGMNPMPYYMAAIEAMDYQIGQLLEKIPAKQRENTIIIFIGDNGTPAEVVQSPYTNRTAKGTLRQGGINVPMFISGKGISRRGTDSNLINGTDLFATIAEIAGIPVSQYNDSKSFKTLFSQSGQFRDYQYSDLKDGNLESWAISNGTYKIIERSTGAKEMYNVSTDPYEQTNLQGGVLSTEASNARTALETELRNIRK